MSLLFKLSAVSVSILDQNCFAMEYILLLIFSYVYSRVPHISEDSMTHFVRRSVKCHHENRNP